MRSRMVYLIAIAVLGALAYLGVQADIKGVAGSLFVAFLSVAVIVFVEAELRPQIRIVQEGEPPPFVAPDIELRSIRHSYRTERHFPYYGGLSGSHWRGSQREAAGE